MTSASRKPSAETDSRTGAGRESFAVHLALFGAQAGFALFPIFGKLVLTSVPPLVLAAIRVVSAALLLEALRRAAGDAAIERRDRPALMLYALLGVSFNQVLFILGLSLTTAIHTTILAATIPVFTLAVAVLLGRETMRARAAIGVALATAGVLVLLDVSNLDWRSGSLRGDLLILANSLSYSCYLVLSRRVLDRYTVRTVVSRIFLYGAGPILVVAAPALLHFSAASVPAASWGGLAAIVVACTLLPYLWNSWALARTEASKVAFYVFLQPLIASVLAVLVLGEHFARRTAIAAALIFAGLGVVAAGRAPSRRAIP